MNYAEQLSRLIEEKSRNTLEDFSSFRFPHRKLADLEEAIEQGHQAIGSGEAARIEAALQILLHIGR